MRIYAIVLYIESGSRAVGVHYGLKREPVVGAKVGFGTIACKPIKRRWGGVKQAFACGVEVIARHA